MKFIVIAKTHNVREQARLINLSARVGDLHAAPIGLPRHQTIAFEQMTDQGFGHWRLLAFGLQQLRCGQVTRAFNVHAVQIQAIEFVNWLFVKFFWQQDSHTAACIDSATVPKRLV